MFLFIKNEFRFTIKFGFISHKNVNGILDVSKFDRWLTRGFLVIMMFLFIPLF